ncbi:DNA topoisomerase 3 [Candidatus Hepatincola sp. Av]
MKLFIAEKPELARAIADAIDGKQVKQNGYIEVGNNTITWCFGHLLCLKNPDEYDEKYKKWQLEDLPFNIKKLQLKPIKGKEKQISIIKGLLKQAEVVINAGDPDEEGQLLVDELLEYLGNTKPVKRILINDNTKPSVKKALEKLKDNKDFIGLKNSAYVRSVADWKYGLNLTRAYTLKANTGKVLSVGRVQTPILNLVYNRECAVKNHIKEKFYNLKADSKGQDFTYVIPSDQLEEGLCKNKTYLESIQSKCETKNNFIISSVEVKIEETSPPLPFNLLKLQAEAFKRYKYKPDKTQDITQKLREVFKAITYNRSDCQYLSDEHYSQREDLVKGINNNLTDFKNLKLDLNLKSKAFNNSNITAHHGIIPTINYLDVSKFSSDELNIYKMIAQRYMLQFLPNKIVEKTTYLAKNTEDIEFKAVVNKLIQLGWQEFYKEEVEDSKKDAEENDNNLSYNKGEALNFKEFQLLESETKPKPLYTQASLLTDLTAVAKYIKNPEIKKLLIAKDKEKKGENGGIGTPATRATILKNLFDRGFIIEAKGKIVTTQLGKDFLACLPGNAKEPDMTALWSNKQEEIKNNQLLVADFLNEIDSFISEEINTIAKSNISIGSNQNATNSGKSSKSSNFSKDKNAKQLNKNSKTLDKTHKCPKCNTNYLQKRVGQYGNFWSCSGYPNCKTSFKDYKGKPQLVKGIK